LIEKSGYTHGLEASKIDTVGGIIVVCNNDIRIKGGDLISKTDNHGIGLVDKNENGNGE
jgi:hypothetical protein